MNISLRRIYGRSCSKQDVYVKPTGLLLHMVDHSDHFSHADSSLSPIHFLQFSDAQWQRYAENRYSYVNRLREDDYLPTGR